MKKFKFRLEKVLQFRETVKSDKKRELSIRLAVLNEEEKRLEELFIAQANNNIPQDAVLSANEFFLRGQYATRLKEEIIKQRLVIIEEEKKVEEARLAYIEASKDVKTLAMLKDKRHEQYEVMLKQEENKVMDEVSTQRAGRTAGLNGE